MNSEEQVIVVGGGPSGMMAAIMAARNSKTVTLVEKNAKLGRKLYITGKGRCNMTNACDVEALLRNVISNRKFLFSAFYGLDSFKLVDFFEDLGLKTKVERGERVFPLSDKSSDVIRTLENELKRLGVKICLNTEVASLKIKNEHVCSVVTKDDRVFHSSKVIIATGGISYSMTGSTGDGYRFAKDSGHTINRLAPGLVPIETNEKWVLDLQGLSLKNVRVKFVQDIKNKNKVIYEDLGEMLFTHFGLTGPLILSGSSFLPKDDLSGIKIVIDLKPALTLEQLDARILRDFKKNNRKNFINALDELLPQKTIPVIVKLSGIKEECKVDQITKEERKTFIHLLKNLECTIKSTRNYDEAIITRGGIDIKNINPNTMESKSVAGLYFVGEVLDLDALTGGFNLQIAFSTGYLAGINV